MLVMATFTAGCSSQSKFNSASYPNPLPAYPNSGCVGQVCPEAEAEVTISGTLSIVQNGHIVFTLFDSQGTSWELLIDETLVQSLGNVQSLSGKKVTVNGTWTADTPAKIRVSSLQINE